MSKTKDDFGKWSAKDYLKQYYQTSEIPTDERAIFNFLVSRLSKIDEVFPVGLEFGSGPTLHHAVCLVPFVKELHLADYVPQNLEESRKWLEKHPGAHNWDVYFEGILKFYSKKSEQIEGRKEELRRKTTKLMHGDLHKPHPLGGKIEYPLVASFYCADSATSSKEEWKKFMGNLFNLVEPGGKVVLSALRNSSGYKVGNMTFPSANVNENDVRDMLLAGDFQPGSLDIEVAKVEEWSEEGFDSIVLATANKNGHKNSN